MRALVSLLLLSAIATPASAAVGDPRARMVAIPAGTLRPLYGTSTDAPAPVAAFLIDRDAVTRGQFLAFVKANTSWRRDVVKAEFAERTTYLAGWRSEFDATTTELRDLHRPVTSVSWFAARAYCEAQGKRLPTMREWEYVASASRTHRDGTREPGFVQELVTIYAQRRAPADVVESGRTNVYGVRGLHDLAWEWVQDFNGDAESHHAHTKGGRPHDLFCASGAIGATDPTNYPAFLRQALRAGLNRRASLETLGFRCAM